jgi:hypothetical protein
MLDLSLALRSDSLMKSLTGLSSKEFCLLSRDFGREIEKNKQDRYEDGIEKGTRKRKSGGGNKGKLRSIDEKLFFVLIYFKLYPTFEVIGFFFGMKRKNSYANISKLVPILEKTLGRKLCLPKRKIRTPEEFLNAFPEIKTVIIDGTERPVQRKKDYGEQKEDYSGKKKRHTQKNILMIDEDKRIIYLGPTRGGRNHDYKMLKEEIPPETMPNGILAWADLGFFGMGKDYPELNVIMPKKKPKGSELMIGDKSENRRISSFRVRVEHAICEVKRFNITTQIFRNRKTGFCDKVMTICSGLWNFRLLAKA